MNLSLDYTSVLNQKHYNFAGKEIDVGHTDSQVMTIYGSYSPSDRVLVSASLPFVNTRHRGAGGGGHDTEIDNGSWHDIEMEMVARGGIEPKIVPAQGWYEGLNPSGSAISGRL